MPAIQTTSWKRGVSPLAVVFLAALLGAPAVHAADQVGGHFGFVLPLITHVNGENTKITDKFNIGFPTGITIKPGGKTFFDLEVVPLIHSDTKQVDLTIHPGVLWSLSGPWTAGLRAAFDVNAKSYGFTPLINYGFPQANGTTLFAEFVLPVRFQRDAADKGQTAVTAGIHLGWAF